MSTNKIITGTVIADDFHIRGERPAAERALEGETVSFKDMEAVYRKPGKTLLHSWFGADPFDFFFGRFYVGTFGVMSLIGIFFGVLFYFYQVVIVEGTFNLLAARLDPPPISAGLSLVAPGEPGFYWQLIVFFATISFIGWALRQVDISRKLDMSYEIPIAYFAVVSSWLTLQWLRPIAMGAWGNGFALGITHHLDWVSNIGYQYFNFFYNPFHAIGISLLFTSTLLLAMHGSIILMASNRPHVREANEDGFWRNLLGYSIGEIGIHRLALWLGVASVLFSNLCIFLSGTLVHDWTQFWEFWEGFPVWEGVGVVTATTAAIVIWPHAKGRFVRAEEQEYGGSDIESTALQRPIQVGWLERLFDLGQVGPVYLGIWGAIAVVAGLLSSFIILEGYMHAVDYNVIDFLRSFFVLSIEPPAFEYGLGFVTDQVDGWHAGNDWIVATFALNIAVLAWGMRLYTRAKAAGLGYTVVWSFAAALFLYFVIYLFRPWAIGNWAQAPGQGFKAILDWTNNVSVQYGNFYYNPFHMMSIFFLLGSTLLLAMHGATIVATSTYGSYREIEEMMTEGTGTQRAQLFWRWCMGFQATSKSIHTWLIWFAALTGITGGIGLFLSGTLVSDWFQWAIGAGIVAPPF
ncbi:MAG: bifunctional photosynthetic reaction center subunit L/M [Anaerolineae bacterium]